jgi:hypothetical protein
VSLLDEVDALVASKRRVQCAVGRLLLALDKTTAADLNALIGDGTTSMGVVSTALRNRNHHVGQASLTRHRRGQCTCDRR